MDSSSFEATYVTCRGLPSSDMDVDFWAFKLHFVRSLEMKSSIECHFVGITTIDISSWCSTFTWLYASAHNMLYGNRRVSHKSV